MTEIDSTGAPASPTAEPAGDFEREFTIRSAFALAFSDVSPIVALYGIFALCLTTAGPAFWWAFPIVLIGQLLVTGVFGELVSRWPLEGSVYQWARHLIGPRYGWFTNWAYMWGLTMACSALAAAGAGFLAGALGMDAPSRVTTTLLALVVLAFATVANMIGSSVLRVLMYVSMAAELVASFVLGTWLLLFHRNNSISVLFDGGGTAHGFAWSVGPLLGAVAFVGWSFVGFESAGAIAEEVKESRRVLPKAIPLALAAVGVLVMYAGLAILLAIPDLPAVLSGKVADPIADTLTAELGSSVGKMVLVALVVGFTASLIAVQASVSRGIWASARDRVIPGSTQLGKLSRGHRLPRNAIALNAGVAGALLLISASKIYALLISFAVAGFFISYALPVVGAAYVRLRGRWVPGEVSLGRAAAPITYVAAVWVLFEIVNVLWPRSIYDSWYLNWGLLLMSGILGVVGGVVCRQVFRAGVPEPSPSTASSSAAEGAEA
jgi:amino acid transporter